MLQSDNDKVTEMTSGRLGMWACVFMLSTSNNATKQFHRTKVGLLAEEVSLFYFVESMVLCFQNLQIWFLGCAGSFFRQRNMEVGHAESGLVSREGGRDAWWRVEGSCRRSTR